MRNEFEPENKPELSEEELVDLIWEEKREKILNGPPTEALYISIPKPEIHIEEIAKGVVETLMSLPPAEAYNWSQNWGRTKVVLSFDEQRFSFLGDESDEAKKTIKLLTDKTVSPQSCLDVEPQGRKYFIVLNGEPSSIEGVVLQTERMVDELVWCLGLKYRELTGDPVEAYRAALEDVAAGGFDTYVLDRQQLLNLRREDDRYQVRIYGNRNSRGKVPQVIGAVGPLGECTRPVFAATIADEAAPEAVPKVEKLTLPDRPFINMGICVAKRPHIGHMLLAGVVEIAKRSISEETLDEIPVVIHANDTGPRIAQTLARCSSEMRLSDADALQSIADGRINSAQLDFFYQTRDLAEKASVVRAESELKKHQVNLPQQAREHGEVFGSFWGSKCQVELESTVDTKLYGPQDVLNDPAWQRTGMSFTKIKGKRYVLESNGFLTASAARSATLNSTSQRLCMGMPIYIDGDRSITDAIDILKAQTGVEGIQFQGAAVGFGLRVRSGTKGDAMPMDDFMEYYKRKYPDRPLLDNVVFLLNTRHQLKPENGLAFFDYVDHEAFVNDLDAADRERNELSTKLRRTAQRLEAAIGPNETGVTYTAKGKEEKWAKHQIGLLLSDYGHERGGFENMFLRPQQMRETPQVQRLIDRMTADDAILKKEAELRVLTAIATGQAEANSNIVDEFRRHGYSAEPLLEAISVYVNQNFSFTRINSLLYQRLESIEQLLGHISIFDAHTGEALLDIFRVACRKLFRVEI